MNRRQLFEAEDEEDLLRLQNEFLAKNEAGAAKVKRVVRSGAPSAAETQHTPAPPASEPLPAAEPTGIQDVAVSSIMGNVLEREIPADHSTVVHPQPANADTPFPEAMHRKLSKFALSRKAAAAGAAAVPGSSGAALRSVSRATATDDTGGMAVMSHTIQERDPAAAPAAAASARSYGAAGLPESAGIDAQNRGVLAAMAPQEVSEALEEVTSRLNPRTLEFLRKRGVARAGVAGAGPAAGAGAASLRTAAGTTPALAAPAVPLSSQYPCLSPSLQSGEHGGSEQAAVSGQVHGQSQQAPQQGVQQALATPTPPAHGVAGLDEEGRLRSDPRLLARLRWGLRAQVTGVQPAGEVQGVEDVLKRDALRADEGSVPDGYTPTEMLLLARSALPAHRAAALQMLTALLLAARPAPSAQGAAPSLQPCIPIPTHLLPQAASRTSGGSQPVVAWSQLWEYLVSELGMASHLRLALDDTYAPVVAAAAGALAALVCPGPEEAVALEVADTCPQLGWPVVHMQPLVRPHVAGTWEAQGVTAPDRSRALPPLSSMGMGGPGGDSEESTPEDVAMVDPLAGLLQMQLLPRLRYLLEVVGLEGAAAVAALQLLAAAARHSQAAAMEVVKCPGLLVALKARLLPAASSISQQSVSAGEGGEGTVAPGHATGGGQQVLVLQVLRLLCQSSALTAQLVRSSGILAAVQGQLVVGCTAAPAALTAGSGPHAALVVIEGVRLWRACAAHGVAPFTYEDMHGLLCPLMTPAPAAAAASGTSFSAGDASAPTTTLSAHLQWHVAREVTLLVERLLAHALRVARGDKAAGRPMLQPGTAAALAQDVGRLWLSPGVVRLAAVAAVSRPDAALRVADAQQWVEWTAAGVHPCLLLPSAHAIQSCLAASLHLVATYWGSVDATLDVFGEVSTALVRSGMLDVSGTGGAPPEAHAQQGGPVMSTTDTLAAALLRTPAAGQQGSSGAAVGPALTAHCLQVAATPSSQHTGAAGTAPHGQASLQFTQNICAHVTAAELLLGCMRLGMALSRQRHGLIPDQPRVASQKGHAAASPALPSCTSELVRQLQRVLPAGLVSDAAGTRLTKALGPWSMARLQLSQPRVRLFLAACRAGTSTFPPGAAPTDGTVVQPPSSARAQAAVDVIDGCLSILPLSPPGAEGQCLSALQYACEPSRLAPVLARAHAAVSGLVHTCPRLHSAASGMRGTGAQDTHAQTQPVPYPPPVQPLDAAAASTALMHGYAASWLSMLATGPEPDTAASGTGGLGAPDVPLEPPCPAPSLPDPSGSRLPAPHTWPLSEVLQLPSTRHAGTAQAASRPPPVHPVEAALALACGMEGMGSAYLEVAVPGGPGAKLAAALALAYVYDSHELVRGGDKSGGNRRAGDGASDGEGEVGVRGGAWWEAGVRWLLASLTHTYGCSGNAGVSEMPGTWTAQDSAAGAPVWTLHGAWCSTQLVEKLAGQFGAVSYGDPLLGCQLAALFASGAPGSTQRALWGALAEDQAFHLLPPLAGCLGQPEQYTGVTRTAGSSASAVVPWDASVIPLITRLLTSGELDKALAIGSVSADVAVAAVIAHMCGSNAVGQEEVAQTEPGGSSGEAASSDGRKRSTAAEQGATTARALVSGMQPRALAALVAAGVRHGWRREDVGPVMVQACRGDLVLMDKLKWVLSQH